MTMMYVILTGYDSCVFPHHQQPLYPPSPLPLLSVSNLPDTWPYSPCPYQSKHLLIMSPPIDVHNSLGAHFTAASSPLPWALAGRQLLYLSGQ